MTNEQIIGFVVLGVVVVGLTIGIILAVRRARYIRALKDRGWTFDSNPVLPTVLDHHAPPFGLGFSRKTDERVTGRTASGVDFAVFEYRYTDAGPTYDRRLASLVLPVALPATFLSSGPTRIGATGTTVDAGPGLRVRSDQPDAARALLNSAVLGAVAAFGQQHGGVDLSVDGRYLVAGGAPKEADELAPYLESLSAVALAVDPAAVAPYAVPPRPPGFDFHDRPDWIMIESDDSMVDLYDVAKGMNNRAEKVIRAVNDGLSVDAFLHRWQTTRTETSTDSEGRTTTRTVTENHSEPILVVNLPFSFGFLNVNSGWGGNKVSFESEPFNDAYAVRCDDARFASDVIHPRMMEMIMAWRPRPFVIGGSRMTFDAGDHDQLVIQQCADFAHAFFSRIPSFVWKNLQVTPPAFRPDPAT